MKSSLWAGWRVSMGAVAGPSSAVLCASRRHTGGAGGAGSAAAAVSTTGSSDTAQTEEMQQQHKQKQHRPLHTDGAIGIRKAAWMRLHPVEKLTVLIDLGRRAPYLLEKPVDDKDNGNDGAGRPAAAAAAALGHRDEQVRFTRASTLSHVQLCRRLPYAVRLQLALSLLLWVRALRDVQDTLARTRSPYAPSSRLGVTILTSVYPTRLQEHWIDWLTGVTCGMDDRLNNTAEQIPAPHTWDPETSETVEDPDSESTMAVAGHRPRHGERQLRRSSAEGGAALARKVQGLTARPGEDDARAARFTAGRHQRRLATLWRRERERARLAGGATAEPPSSAIEAVEEDSLSAAETARRRERLREGWTARDADRTPPPVSLVPVAAAAEDARYHGNTGRGEGCPFTDDGRTSATPIHIPTARAQAPNSTAATATISAVASATLDSHQSRPERILAACVQLHAAVFSSLFVEGRTAQVTVDDATVFAYGQWLLEELAAEKYVTLELIGKEGATGRAASLLLPYYPAYCFSTVLVLCPPKRPASVSAKDLAFLTNAVMQAAPCDVLVAAPDSNSTGVSIVAAAAADVGQAAFLAALKGEVDRQRSQLHAMASVAAAATGASAAADFDRQWRVSWVTLGRPRAPAPGDELDKDAAEAVAFTPKMAANADASSGGHFAALVNRTASYFAAKHDGTSSGTATPSSHGPSSPATAAADAAVPRTVGTAAAADAFLSHVSAALEHNFYSAQLLLLPHNSLVTQRQLRHWLWQGLPANVRLVGVNASPLDALAFYPHASFLTQKVGNLFRYRAVTRSVVARHDKPLSRDPVRYALARIAVGVQAANARASGKVGGNAALGFEAQLCPADRVRIRAKEQTSAGTAAAASGGRGTGGGGGGTLDTGDAASGALVLERTVDYLANPRKATLFALFAAKLFRL